MNILTCYRPGFSLEALKERKVTAVIVNGNGFSSFDDATDIKALKEECEKIGLKVWVRMDCLYEEKEIDDVRRYLHYLDEIKVEGVMFTDLAVNEIALQDGLSFKRTYTPETLLTNTYDVSLLCEDMDYCVISQDITLKDIMEIIDGNRDRCMLRIHGPILLSYSKRHFISAYLKDKKDEYRDGYYLIEETRTNKMPIVQGERGTWLYGNVLESLSEIKMLNESPLAALIIDNNLYGESYNLAVIDLYNAVAEGKIDHDEAYEKLRELDPEIGYTELSNVQESWLDKESA
ncbi:MAG: U32 family peptidase [Erysipelotrichaceae bacterium]|nr:U32 family peptidase [Erysipelotrichaceae bacterium]